MVGYVGKDLERSGSGLMDVQFHQLLGGSEANHGKSQSKIAGVPAEI
jgi:hypothetical protein